MKKPRLIASALFTLLLLYCVGDWYTALPADSVAVYVGRDRCASCHQQESHAWQGSHHDRAMEPANEQTVEGDFNDTEFTRLGVTTRFFRRGNDYYVNTEGPDGEHHDYQVKYTFGVEPLQQYMVELEGGRVQVLRVSWDTENEEWFYVPPPDAVNERLRPDDPLHWTGIAQNWNTMCAECHSTNLRKNFHLASNTYSTEYSEIDVSCEACHGPASLHVELAESNSLFWDRRLGYGLPELKNVTNARQLETCAPCHSRRSMIQGGFHAGDKFLNHFDPSLLEPGLYHAGGQILDEVYVYASFLQSRMYHEGVKCTDCHDPHSLKPKFPGNRLCTQCHQPGKYDGQGHHHHTDAEATRCVNCHMPERHYMVVDGRRDHSFRIPRPDLSVELDTPNACNDCHTKEGEDAAWAADAVRKWYGEKRPNDPHYAPALAAGWANQPDGVSKIRDLLRRDHPDVVRATALRALGGRGSPEADKLCREALTDRSPLVRAAALRSLSDRTIGSFALELAGQLQHSSLLVRSAAAERLVGQAARLIGTKFEPTLEKAVAEYFKGQEEILDRAGTHMRRATLHEAMRKPQQAIESLRTAMRLEPYLAGPRAELARLMEQRGGDKQDVQRLRTKEADLLARDCDLVPNSPILRYRLGLLLYLLDRNDEAVAAMQEACRLAPESFDFLTALALLYEREQRWEEAVDTLKRMNTVRPDDPTIAAIYQRILTARQQGKAEQ